MKTINKNHSGIYLLICKYEDVILLKIGKSENVFKRFSQHKASNPNIEFMCYIQTEHLNIELEIHHKFKMHKHSREWFNYDFSIVNFFQKHSSYNLHENKETKTIAIMSKA